jgi:hypothetical protein
VWTALVGGAVGAVVTALVAGFAWWWSARADVRRNDLVVAHRDEDLRT